MTRLESKIRPMAWEDGALSMLDQRALPRQEVWLKMSRWEEVRDAIVQMAVRGAPAIGVAAAYGMALAAQAGSDRTAARAALAASRPTAVNLFWALDRSNQSDWTFAAQLANARAIELEDLEMNHQIGSLGAELIPTGAKILTICNTGSLATAGHGTALGIIRTAYLQGKVEHVFACETRPRQQGLRLTAWELTRDGIPFHAVVEGAVASLMARGDVDFVVAGADRIAANGDTANKIGTFSLACLAQKFGIPFVIAAPSSTVDPRTACGGDIPIEERDACEVTHIEGIPVAPDGCPVWNPAFDVTPAELITALVTEKGIWRMPYRFD